MISHSYPPGPGLLIHKYPDTGVISQPTYDAEDPGDDDVVGVLQLGVLVAVQRVRHLQCYFY